MGAVQSGQVLVLGTHEIRGVAIPGLCQVGSRFLHLEPQSRQQTAMDPVSGRHRVTHPRPVIADDVDLAGWPHQPRLCRLQTLIECLDQLLGLPFQPGGLCQTRGQRLPALVAVIHQDGRRDGAQVRKQMADRIGAGDRHHDQVRSHRQNRLQIRRAGGPEPGNLTRPAMACHWPKKRPSAAAALATTGASMASRVPVTVTEVDRMR